MSDLVAIVIEDDRWATLGIGTLAEKAARAALRAAEIPVAGLEISLLACSDAPIIELNQSFRGKRQATNVLSWPAFELAPDQPGDRPESLPPAPVAGAETGLGDIAISYDTCLREAGARKISLDDHAFHLIVHGCLHLLGYDHQRDADATVMEALEVKALATAGISNPY